MKRIHLHLLAGLTALCLTLSQNTAAQIQVGSAQSTKGPGKISAEDLSAFKKTTTYFILQEKDYENVDAFQAAIAKVWTITPFKIIKPDERRGLNLKQASFFDFGGFVVSRQGQSLTTVHVHLSYDLFMLVPNKKDKLKQKTFGKFLLHLDGDAYKFINRYASANSKHFGEKVGPYLYKQAEMQNWSPVMIAGYLKVINDGLQSNTLRSVFDEYLNKEAIKDLQTQSLYVPNYVNNRFNKITGTEKEVEEDEEDTKSAYPFPIQYCSLSELAKNTAANKEQGVYYLSYIKSSSDKYVSIFDSRTGKMIYTAYTPMSYNFKTKDLKRIANKIK
jgi:hypothetical protein